MKTFCATTPRQFQGEFGRFIEDVTIRAKTPTAAARRYALRLASTSPHESFEILRKRAGDKPLRVLKTKIVSEFCAYASVGFINTDGSKAYIPFEFYIAEDKGPIPDDPNMASGL